MPPAPQVPEPVRGRRVLILRAFFLGEADAAERLLAPLRDAAGPPLLDGMRATTFADAAAMTPTPPPMVGEMSFGLFHEVPDEAIAAAVEAEGLSGVELRHWGGAMARPEPGSGPIGHRDVPFSIVAAAQSEDREQADRLKAAVDGLGAKLAPYATGGSFLNFLGDAGKTEAAYTPDDYRRLREVKAAYDPDNVFAANHNIPPAA
jgi:Berberine and berberine like